MQIIDNTTQFQLDGKSAVAIGKFDGIHRGHKKLLDNILAAKEDGLQAVVFTFDPPPNRFFGGSQEKELTTKEEKRRLFAEMGIDILVEFPLNRETAAIRAAVFVEDILVGRLHAVCIAAGADVSFGYRKEGGIRLLHSLSPAYGYEVHLVDKVRYEDREISSTFVREEVGKGNMQLVGALLGAPYHITGSVMHGRRLGRTLGMPTVNLMPPALKLLPPNGVYDSAVRYRDKRYKGITNIGVKPTVSREQRMGVETYVYDFEEEIYGKELTVELLEFKRPEMLFDSVEQLKRQMQRDIAEGRERHFLK